MALARVAGTGFEDRALKIKNWCKEGQKVFLKREPNNKFDKNAIKVLIETKPLFGIFGIKIKHIGYIKAERASKLAPKMDNGLEFSATISKIYAPKWMDFPTVTIEFYPNN